MRIVVRFLAVLALTLPAFCGEVQWFEIHSPHFSVVTDTSDKRGRDVAARFEQMRAVFGSLMVKAKVNTPVPLQIIAFRSSKELRQFSPLFQGKPTELAGLFQGGSDRGFILLDMSQENPWQIVFHEYAHQLMNGTIPDRLDPWFEEGFAEYFRTITVDGKEADVGRIPTDEYTVLDQNGWLKIADLLRVQQNTKTYNESGDHRDVFYAESGMLVHYIYDNALLPKLGEYYNLVENQHLSVEDAVQKAFGMSAPQFDKALLNYEKSGHYKYYKLAAPVGIDAKTYTSAPLKMTDAQAVLADAHLHSHDYQAKAVEEFEAVLKADPDNSAAMRGLGYSYLMKQDLGHAGEYFHKSARANPNDPRVLYYSAMLYQREGAKPETIQAMQSELEQSIKLDPEFADAHSLLAWAYMSGGEQGKAIASLRKAIELNPRNDQYRFNLAGMYVNHQRFDDAITILRPLAGSSDPQVASRSAEQLTQVQQYRDQMRAMSQPSPRDVNGNALVNSGTSQLSGPEPIQLKVRPAKFLHGKLLSVDCWALPAATVTILSGSTKLALHVSDSKKAMVIGADTLSCDWTNQKVAVNYRETEDGKGDLISLELQ